MSAKHTERVKFDCLCKQAIYEILISDFIGVIDKLGTKNYKIAEGFFGSYSLILYGDTTFA